MAKISSFGMDTGIPVIITEDTKQASALNLGTLVIGGLFLMMLYTVCTNACRSIVEKHNDEVMKRLDKIERKNGSK